MYKAVLGHLHLDERNSVLDAGCGSGLFLTMASSTGAKIYGIDAAPGLLEITKQRLPEGTFMLEDLEEIPFTDNSFDVVAGFNSFQFAGDKIAALKQAKQAVRKGGKMVVAIWDEAKNSDASFVFASIGALLPPPPPNAPGPWALSAAGTMERICEDLDLTILHKEKIACPWLFTDQDELFKAFMCTGPAVKASEILGQQRVKDIIEQGSQPFRLADDIYFMNNYFNFFVLEK